MENNHSRQEHRRYNRLPYENPLEFQVCSPGFLSELRLGSSRNVSASGLCFTTDCYAPEGTVILIQLDLKGLMECLQLEKMLFELNGCVLGKIVWSQVSQEDPTKFDVGVVFIKTEEAGSEDLQEVLASLG